MKPITENHIEQYAIEELQALGYGYVCGPEIEREDFGQIVLIENLRRHQAGEALVNVIDKMLLYFRWHVADFTDLKSPGILSEVLR